MRKQGLLVSVPCFAPGFVYTGQELYSQNMSKNAQQDATDPEHAPEDRKHFDCLIVGTGLTESILAA
jgi:hypothetical protein